MGGSDQWGNIVSGIELIRRMGEGEAYGITFPLITTSSGEKMGKTAKGAVWLDGGRTSPYEYYQFWVNTDDRDVRRFMALFTFLPMEEIAELDRLTGAALNAAKCVLGFEATRLVHGGESAAQAYWESVKNFGAPEMPGDIMPSSGLHEVIARTGTAASEADKVATDPHTADSFLNASELAEGIPAFKLFHQVGLVGSRGEARRLIEQGGAYANGVRLEAFDTPIDSDNVEGGEIVLRAGKKRYHRIGVK
jgi:tyrosyl-tRNA synthetase